MPPATAPPLFLREAAHPLRWQLLATLSRSDLRVRELCEATGEAQNLVSYHLGRLRSARLVSARHSSADRRDAYYRLDLARCAELLASAGDALHPALRHRAAPPFAPPPSRPARVLFLCTGNSARSQMAEAMLRQRLGPAVDVHSAGSHPKPLHPEAVRAMAARGIDISAQASRHFSEFAGQTFDFVVTLCDRVREVCPEFPGPATAIHWSMPDPSAGGSTEAFQRTAGELETRLDYFVRVLGDAPKPQEVA